LVVVAGWKRRKKNVGFRFSIPKIPELPKLRGIAGKAARRIRFFWPNSPSHPSSLGWLNSKVPKPFSPFTLRLIDVDGF
jgi:hypothetical protein